MKPIATSKMTNLEQMNNNLERVIMWVSNCDQKASILLTLDGVIATIICTSGEVDKVKSTLVDPFVAYWREGVGSFSFFRFLLALVLFAGIGLFFAAIIYLLLCLTAKTKYSKFKQLGIEDTSLLHFDTVSQMSYMDFCNANNNFENDLRSQYYINSIRCSDKFRKYRIASVLTLIAVPLFAIAFALMLFV